MKKIFGLLLLLAFHNTKGQDLDLELFAERLFQVQEADSPYEDLYESLLMYYSHPLNLNKASREQLQQLYILNSSQIQNLISHIQEVGPLLSIYELQTVEGFDQRTIETLRSFVQVKESQLDNRKLLEKILGGENAYLFTRYSRRLPAPDVYETDKFAGSPDHLYARFRSTINNDYSLGFTLEKDPGEAFWQDSIKGFDFASFHFQLENRGALKNMIVGDFQYQVGQGLLFGAGFNPGKGAETILSTMRNTIGARPYTSVLENGFFRGLSVTFQKKELELSLFASYNKRNARIRSDTSLNELSYFTSLNSIGLHRSASELATRRQVEESTTGGYIRYSPSQATEIGVAGIYTRFSSPLIPLERSYNYFEFRGLENYLGSVYFRQYIQNITLFGEIGRSRSGGIGAIAGMTAILHPKVETSLLYRNYTRDFHSFYGNSFGETARNINEKGLYWGWKVRLDRAHHVNLYFDYFTFPWLRFRVDSPSSGYEWMMRYSFTPDREQHYFLQIRQENKERTLSTDPAQSLMMINRTNYIVNADYPIMGNISGKTRIQGSIIRQKGLSSGIALVQDINIKFEKVKLSFRYSIFETDDFDNRQYIYERDVLYAFSIPAYFGQGMRYYGLLHYKMTPKLNLWLKLSRFSYPYDQSIGSGDNTISGNQQTDLRVQIQKKF